MDIYKLKGIPLDGARWVSIPTMPGVSLKVRGNSYPDYLDEISRLTRRAPPESFEDGTLKFHGATSDPGSGNGQTPTIGLGRHFGREKGAGL